MIISFAKATAMEGIVSKKRYVVKLTEEERQHLTDILRKGTHPTRRVQKAQILLRADAS